MTARPCKRRAWSARPALRRCAGRGRSHRSCTTRNSFRGSASSPEDHPPVSQRTQRRRCPPANRPRIAQKSSSSEQVLHAVERGLAKDQFDRDAAHADGDPQHDDHDVLEQDRERDEHRTKRRERVQPRERRRDERSDREQQHDQAEDGVAQPMVEKPARTWAREALQEPYRPEQRPDELLLPRTLQRQPPPALREPHHCPAGDQLKRKKHGDQLEDMSGATGRDRKSGHTQKQDENNRKALLLEDRNQGAKGLGTLGSRPALDLI